MACQFGSVGAVLGGSLPLVGPAVRAVLMGRVRAGSGAASEGCRPCRTAAAPVQRRLRKGGLRSLRAHIRDRETTRVTSTRLQPCATSSGLSSGRRICGSRAARSMPRKGLDRDLTDAREGTECSDFVRLDPQTSRGRQPIEMEALLVSRLDLGHPTGIANLAFVSDRLTH
jgi:hypothetical protein